MDTNVFVSSFFGGTPRKIIDFWKDGSIHLCLSREIIDEYVEVLQRMGLRNEKELEDLLDLFARGFHVVFTAQTPTLHVIDKDPDDNKFIECAVALKAVAVITGDKAVLDIKNYMGIQILTPRHFLDRFGKK